MNYDAIARLVERAMQGDSDAFTDLYDLFSKSVYYMALRLTKNEDDANDVVQDTMLELYESLHSIKDCKAIGAFIKKIAFRQCTRIMRDKKKRQSFESDAESSLLLLEDLDEEFLPEKYVDQKEQREYMISIIDKLSDPLRTVTMLYYYDRYSISHIANILKLDEGTVRTRMSRARTALKKEIQISKHELIRSIAPIPVLTRIFQTHADEVFTTERSISLWQNIASKLGYSPETIERTTAIIAGSATAAGAATAVSTTATSAVISSLLSSTVASATLIGATCLAAAITATTMLYHSDIETPRLANAVAVFSQNADPYEGINHSNTVDDIASPELPQDSPYVSTPFNNQEVLDVSGEIVSEDHYQTNNTPTQALAGRHNNYQANGIVTEWQSSFPLPQTTIIREEGAYYILSNPNVPLAPPTLPIQLPQLAANLPQITVANSTLTFTAGEAVTEAEILQHAGITANGQQQAVVLYLNEVDFNTPSKYAVLVQLIDNATVLSQRVIFIQITK